MYTTTSIIFLSCITLTKGFNAPWFCHGIDCPVFSSERNITRGGTDVELRRYGKGQLWASTVIEHTDLMGADQKGFQLLFNYISGENKENKKVDMTSPVRDYVRPPHSALGRTNYTVAFYVPYIYQPTLTPSSRGPPQPSNPSVFISEDVTELRAAVVGFPGFASDDEVVDKLRTLKSVLDRESLTYDRDNWFYSAYDPPFRVANRHNEVWVRLQ